MKEEKINLYSRYKKDLDACKNGYYGYELWLENKLIELESKIKKLQVSDSTEIEEEMKYNKNVYFQPDFSCEETLFTPDGVELWSYYVYASFDNARRDFPERQIIAYKGDDIEGPYFIDGNGNY